MLAGCVPWPEEDAARYRREGWWQGEPLGELCRTVARDDPERVALVAGERRTSYGELDAWADRLAAGFAGVGLQPHERVVVQLPNTPELVAVSLGLFRAGLLPVYALSAHRQAEVEYLSAYSAAVAYVVPDVWGGFDYRPLAEAVQRAHPSVRRVVVAGEADGFTSLASLAGAAPAASLPAVDPGDVAFFLLSGGTTGRPKLIPRTHDDYRCQLRAAADAMAHTAESTYLAALPAAHNAALGCPGVLGTLLVGGKVVLADGASPDAVFPVIASEGVTLTTLMPALLGVWARVGPLYEADLSGVVVEVGGARLDPAVARLARENLGCRISHWFGMAEGVHSCTPLDAPDDVVDSSQGKPIVAVDEWRVIDEEGHAVEAGAEGELAVGGPCTIRGYYQAEAHDRGRFTPDGLLRTGDLVRVDAAGDVAVTGRIKDVVNRGGEKVSADELEEQLRTHPGVREAAVVAMPDRSLGEKTCAFVVAAGGVPTLPDVRAHLSACGVAEFKQPDRLEVVTCLPLTNMGKVDKASLRARFDAVG